MDLNDLRDFANESNELKEEHLNILKEFMTYNSRGMISFVIEILRIYNEKIEKGIFISYSKTNNIIDKYSFRNLIYEEFGEYIFENVFDIKIDD